jgi:hypothetical protein
MDYSLKYQVGFATKFRRRSTNLLLEVAPKAQTLKNKLIRVWRLSQAVVKT